MRTSFKLALSAVMLATVFAAPADAKRRGGFGFFRMPSGEAVVLVKDLPNKPELRRDDGKYVDLGYHFTRTGGEWVGYVGSSTQYLALESI
jgi:hypothetical protein